MKERPQIEIVGWLPSAEAAKRLKIEQGTVRQLVHKGKLDPHYVGSRLYVSEESIERYALTRGARQGGRPRKQVQVTA